MHFTSSRPSPSPGQDTLPAHRIIAKEETVKRISDKQDCGGMLPLINAAYRSHLRMGGLLSRNPPPCPFFAATASDHDAEARCVSRDPRQPVPSHEQQRRSASGQAQPEGSGGEQTANLDQGICSLERGVCQAGHQGRPSDPPSPKYGWPV